MAKLFESKSIFAVLVFQIFCLNNSFPSHANLVGENICSHPQWNSPAESRDGVFHGDLLMDCKVRGLQSIPDLNSLRAGIIKKISTDSVIHEQPTPEALKSAQILQWDVSHRISEDENNVTIREEATIETNQKNQLTYRTHSKKVIASGMAGFLKSVNFSMTIEVLDQRSLQVQFKNEVHVERPWYALDFIFTPLAQNICFDKMEKVRKKIFPWVLSLL
jgi:hypothetical protein